MCFRLVVSTALLGAAAGSAFAQAERDERVLFGDLPSVEAAALHAQTLAEAPANVTVITAQEIRRYGYRTLAEALSSVRGFYATYDHLYHFVGVSGISLPGDFNTRFLVMLNGHPLTDNIYSSNNFFGQDFGLDMDLVERIEIIRGPTSALYGSNGMLANINVVTRSPVDGEKMRVSSETDGFGSHKLGVSSSVYLGHGANLLISASVFRNSGGTFPIDGRDVDNADGERGYHTFANLIWRKWSFTAYFNSRDKQPPIGLGTSLSGDPGQHVVDSRDLLGATYKRQAGNGKLQWQTFYDRYRYRDRYDYPHGDTVRALRDYNHGDSLDTELIYELPVHGANTLTVGVEGFWQIRTEQYNMESGPRLDYSNHPDAGGALFAQQEWEVARGWKVYAGLRLDESKNYGRFFSPRLALVYQQSPSTVYKLVYGRPFRNPSAFEQFYNDGGLSYAAAATLRPEVANTFQASLEHKLGTAWTLVLDAFHYQIGRVIEAVALDDSVQQYQNSGRDRSAGVEAEITGKLWDRLEIGASTAMQQAIGGEQRAWLANSPRHVVKGRAALPLFGARFTLAGALNYLSARGSWSGDRLGGAVLADTTATVKLSRRFDVQAGVPNLFDRRYEDPIYLTVDRLAGDGRSAYIKLVWRVLE